MSGEKGGPSLGKRAFRVSKFRLLDVARRVLGDDSSKRWATCSCMRSLSDGRSGVSVNYVPKTESAHYGGIQTCGSVWTCPVCSVKISARRGELVKRIVEKSGLTPVLVTYTLQHSRDDLLTRLLDDLKIALRYQRNGAARKRFNERFRCVGYIRSHEIRRGEANGWHPHAHELLLLDMPAEDVRPDEIKAQLMSRYGRKLEAMGYLVNEHTVDVRVSAENRANTVDEYLTKSSIELELTRGQEKESRVESLSPFQLLAMFETTGEVRYMKLFQEYAHATFGKKQMIFSRGLLALCGEEELSDEELAAQQEETAVVLTILNRDEWRRVLKLSLRAQLLFVAEQANPLVLDSWLVERGIRVSIGQV